MALASAAVCSNDFAPLWVVKVEIDSKVIQTQGCQAKALGFDERSAVAAGANPQRRKRFLSARIDKNHLWDGSLEMVGGNPSRSSSTVIDWSTRVPASMTAGKGFSSGVQ